MNCKTTYANASDAEHWFYKVVYRNEKTKAILKTSFQERPFCEAFVRKLKHSKTCTLLSYPTF